MNPPTQVTGQGEEQGCQEALSSGLGVCNEQVQSHSLGQARDMDTVWINTDGDGGSDFMCANVLWLYGSDPVGLRVQGSSQ